MCEHGSTVDLLVPVPAGDAWEGEMMWKIKPIDLCLAPIIVALNSAGVLTRSHCCGHGQYRPEIVLHDGRILVIFDDPDQAALAATARSRR